MSKKSQSRIPKQSSGTKSPGKIPNPTLFVDAKGSTDNENPSFRFKYVDKSRWCLSDWQSKELDDLIQALKKIENYTWEQIRRQGSKTKGGSVGTGYKIINNPPPLPADISEDVTFSEMRVCQRKRIFGFRSGSIYYIVWFDRDHSVCPE